MIRARQLALLVSVWLFTSTSGALADDDEAEPSSPPASEAVDDDEGDEPEAEGRGARRGLGVDPSTLRLGDLVIPTEGEPGALDFATDKYSFQFHGFMRIPLRIGFGTAEGGDLPADQVQEGTKVHLPPQIPDGSYTDWRYLNNLGGPWTELQLSYGNANVSANVSVAAWDITGGSYSNLSAQLGINQAFVTLRSPELFGDRGGILANAGVFSNRYGAAGKYSAGKYETYLFGATHVAGESVAAFVDLTDSLTIQAEHGFGGKLAVAPFVQGVPGAPYLPYPGPEQQGGTLLHHAHVGLTFDDKLTIAFHYLTSWTDDARLLTEKDGRITTIGGDIKLIDAFFGDGYIGFSHLKSQDPLRVAGALEALHTTQGWNLRDVYFGPQATGTGTINSLLFQYTFSLARALWYPEEFWGQGRDLMASVYGMFNSVRSSDENFTGAKEKLKFGGELTYTPLGWLGLSARYDLVQPNMDDNTESFHVLSPKLILRSAFVSHEQLIVQYSHYFYGDNVLPAWPHAEKLLKPDANVLKFSAIMWW